MQQKWTWSPKKNLPDNLHTMIDIQSELKKNPILLSVFSSEYYNKLIINIMQNLTDEKICYVTLNRSSDSLVRNFKSNSINTENIFFIDAITKIAIPNPPASDNCIFVPSPDDLTKLGIAITQVLQTFDPECLIFDSLSTLLVYSDLSVVSQFVHSVVNKINAYAMSGVFLCLYGEKEKQTVTFF